MVQQKTKSRRKNGAGFKRLPKGANGGIELLKFLKFLITLPKDNIGHT